MKTDPKKIVNGLGMGTSCTSTGVYIDQILTYSIQAIWTGSPQGTLSVQASNDIVPIDPTSLDPAANVTNWTTYTNGTQTLTGSGTAGSYLWNSPISGYSWVRLTWTSSTATGTLNATFFGKG